MTENTPDYQPDKYAIVELMGHVKLAGKVSQESQFGATFLRIDVPGFTLGESVYQPITKLVNAQNAVYSITFVDQNAMELAAREFKTQPYSEYSLTESLKRLKYIGMNEDIYQEDEE